MSDELKSGVLNHIQPAIEAVANSPKVAMTIGTATAGAGIDAMFWQNLPLYLGIVATVLGIVLTSVLIYRNLLLTIREDREYKYKIIQREDESKTS